jgi:hypothetical protein
MPAAERGAGATPRNDRAWSWTLRREPAG